MVYNTEHMKNKNFLVGILIGAVVIGGIWLIQSRVMTIDSAINYNCELSGGEFTNGTCRCPVEEGLGQTSTSMYDKSTGFCQSTAGGPAGDAFNASVGLPYGSYEFYFSVVGYQCSQSGGEFLNARCDCGSRTYDDTTGLCR